MSGGESNSSFLAVTQKKSDSGYVRRFSASAQTQGKVDASTRRWIVIPPPHYLSQISREIFRAILTPQDVKVCCLTY